MTAAAPSSVRGQNGAAWSASTSCAERVYEGGTNYALLELLPAQPGRVLDCGCGAGDNAAVLQRHGWRCVGITISAQEGELAGRYCDVVALADLDNGLPAGLGQFDVVLMSHVLEHLRHPERLLASARAVLAPGGVVAVALPNVLFYRYRMRFLGGRFQYEPGGVMDSSHVHFYTFESGAELLRENGYEIIYRRAEGFFPLRFLRRIIPRRVVGNLTSFACARWPGLFGIQSLYIARPVPAR